MGTVRVCIQRSWPLAAFLFGAACTSRSSEEAAPEPTPTPPAGDPDAVAEVPAAVPSPSLEERYQTWRTRFEQDETLARSDAFSQIRADLQEVANTAPDRMLRANAALLLAALHEGRREPANAEGFYRLAANLVPDDAGPKMALALVLAAQKNYPEAATVQAEATALDPDNLENWLILGELLHKSGQAEKAAEAYVDYERRRKGLIDGLTLTRQGAYIVSRDERIACAEALASATDQGTAVAMAYALHRDPEPAVRAAVARIMGLQRLAWYRDPLEEKLKSETSPEVREAILGALAEIARDPLEITATPSEKPSEPDAEPPGGPSSEGASAKPSEGASAKPSEGASANPSEGASANP